MKMKGLWPLVWRRGLSRQAATGRDLLSRRERCSADEYNTYLSSLSANSKICCGLLFKLQCL